MVKPLVSVQPQTKPILVIGAGLAGAACARALADRGWQVKVLDAAPTPATVGSGLPVGIFGPHYSSDDARLSQITRNGVRQTWQAGRHHLRAGLDWDPLGVMEHRLHGRAGVDEKNFSADNNPEHLFSHEANAAQKQALGLPPQAPVTWHPYAGWIKPAELVKALLHHPLITFQGNSTVARLACEEPGQWCARDSHGEFLAKTHWVIVAGGPFSRALMTPDAAKAMPLDAVRGQLTWSETANATDWPAIPVNGHGSLIAQVPLANTERTAWFAGATFDRSPGQPDWSALDQLNHRVPTSDADTHVNLQKLAALLPKYSENLHHHPQKRLLNAWASIRCTSADRLPWVGPVDETGQPGLWLCTAMGARGLSWALLCAELLASWACGEPLPLEASHARALVTQNKQS
jgi:tRNA 5-methylaminomethyl-2-thiouridine biosynthesis bifunctional protein